MSAAEYGINFGYKAQDGYYYGPNGTVGLYHRGNDRPCPTGTPIIISGFTIGLTGATGIVSGPHLHTQACTADANWSNDIDPGPYEFKPGAVIKAGYHSQFGNQVTIRVGGADITYAHLSEINVAVGQQIGADVIGEADVAPVRIVMSEVEGWDGHKTHAGDYDGQIMGAWQGKPWPEMIYHCWSVNNVHRFVLEERIGDLSGQLKTTTDKLNQVTAKADISDKLQKQVDDLTAQNKAVLDQQAKDTETGNSFLRWIGGLFNKN